MLLVAPLIIVAFVKKLCLLTVWGDHVGLVQMLLGSGANRHNLGQFGDKMCNSESSTKTKLNKTSFYQLSHPPSLPYTFGCHASAARCCRFVLRCFTPVTIKVGSV
ncbi:hypothetical protein ILYODFUR_015614 [Ilyodon furcidens]|uniref:Secreted protein n=1 Tax=Ilyodon furcidens TaxID=33524 RepID=A0ABV0V4B8_9TELE